MAKKKASNLVPVKKMITRNGTTFETTVLVNPNKKDTVSNKKTTVPLEDWAKIKTLDDFEKARKHIYKYDDVARKDILKEEFVDFLERSGVYWERSDDFAIDYMRAMTKAKMMIKEERFVAHDINSNDPRPTTPYKRVPKAEARKIMQKYSKLMQFIVQDSKGTDNEYKDVDHYLEETLELYNISWQKSDHKGVNHMRMMMAMREAIQEGRKTPMSHMMEANPDHQKYLNFKTEQAKKGKYDMTTIEGVIKSIKEYKDPSPPWKTPKQLVPFKEVKGALGTYRQYEGDKPLPRAMLIGRPPKEPNPNRYKGGKDSPKFQEKYKQWMTEYNAYWKKHDYMKKDIVTYAEENYNRPLLFKTPKEVYDWADSIGIKIDKGAVEEVDIHCWVDIAPALEEMLEKFPQMRTFTFKDKDGTIRTEPLTIHYQGNTDNTFMMGGVGGLWLTSMLKDYKDTMTRLFKGNALGFNQFSDGTFKGVVRHECGHVLETMIVQNNMGYQYYKKAKKDVFGVEPIDGNLLRNHAYAEWNKDLEHLKKQKGHSEYSQKNNREVFAESFTALMSGQHNIKFAEGIKNLLTKWGVMK